MTILVEIIFVFAVVVLIFPVILCFRHYKRRKAAACYVFPQNGVYRPTTEELIL